LVKNFEIRIKTSFLSRHVFFATEKVSLNYELELNMKTNCSSKTASRVAMRRAAHQIMDDPVVFSDPLAFRILGAENQTTRYLDPELLKKTPAESKYRAYLATRSRYAEDELHKAIKRGVHQYVILGAGLDTFAYRNQYPGNVLHVFEVDHPATQTWKRERLKEADINIPRTLTFSPVDFETGTLEEGLRRAGFHVSRCAFFSWLGMTSYITGSAFTSTLRFVASMPPGSGIVFDYMISPSLLNPAARSVFDNLANQVASGGEPFQTFFDPRLLGKDLQAMGFGQIKDLGPRELNDLYFSGRKDGLKAGGLAHIMNAIV
jgi:methyltransferase (TIGR00027 family)